MLDRGRASRAYNPRMLPKRKCGVATHLRLKTQSSNQGRRPECLCEHIREYLVQVLNSESSRGGTPYILLVVTYHSASDGVGTASQTLPCTKCSLVDLIQYSAVYVLINWGDQGRE